MDQKKLNNHKTPSYKRPLDISILLLTHIPLFPIWLLLWTMIPLCIMLDSGRPIFYRMKKVGKNGNVISVFKFRTMVVDADKSEVPYTLINDERITKFGKVLRKTALDELPQLINILRGEMSFVGIRPFSPRAHQAAEEETPGWAKRLEALPGLTSAMSVWSNPDNQQERLEMDLYYIRNQSFFLDLKIFFLSILIAFKMGWEKKRKN